VNKFLPILLSCLLLPACMTLPGSDVGTTSRYMLKSPVNDCTAGERPLALSVTSVSAGLDTNRIARRDDRSGEFSYLKNVRWVAELAPMMEQRLAGDLECRGFTVLTSHHGKLSYERLVCEVRALNLIEDGGGDQAEVGLSCLYFRPGTKSEVAVRSYHSAGLRSWSADDAVAAMSDAYRQVFKDLSQALKKGSEPF
jgi:ABC-type uncharacterized transport system auxiliary subunit